MVIALIIALLGAIFLLFDWNRHLAVQRKSKALESKRTFVRFISHEVRTPLNSVHMGTELLMEEVKGVDAARAGTDQRLVPSETLRSWEELIADVIGNCECAVDVLNDLLNYDKIEMGTLRLDFTAVPIRALVRKSVKAFRLQAAQKGLELHDTPPPPDGALSGLIIIGDAMRIEQIVRNMLSNALKFTPSGGSVTVHTQWVANGLPDTAIPEVSEDRADLRQLPRAGSVRVSVTDTGVGLTTQQLAQICAEGVQFNANLLQAGQGSGLGLFISRDLAEQHKGTLTATSPGPGQGTTFTLELPACQVQGAEEQAANGNGVSQQEDHTISEQTQRSKLVLVVEDALSNRQMMVRLLRSRGHTCEEAGDGQQAIHRYTTCALQASRLTSS
jgi:signal transduction histidine kinase